MKTRFLRPGILVFALALLSLGLWRSSHRPNAPARITQFDVAAFRGGPATNGPAIKLVKPPGMFQKAALAQKAVRAGTRDPKAAQNEIGNAIQTRFKSLTSQQSGSPRPPLHGTLRGSGRTVLDPVQQKAIDELYALLGPGAELQMDQVDGTVRYIRGDLKKTVEFSPEFMAAREQGDYGQMALATLSAVSRVMNIKNPAAEFAVQTSKEDELHMVHVKLDQKFNDVPIFGAQVAVHFAASGDPVQIQGVYAPSPARPASEFTEISQDAALAKAREAVGASGPGLKPPQIVKTYYWEPNVAPALAYQVDLTPTLAESWHVFVSVADGAILHTISDICPAAAEGQASDVLGATRPVKSWQAGTSYLAIDTSLPMYDAARSKPPTYTNLFGAIAIFDAQNQSKDFQELLQTGISYASSTDRNQWDPTVVSVMNNFARVYDYFKTTHNRNSFDDQGISLTGIIHCQFNDPNGRLYKDNAFFTGALKLMVFGDGEKVFGPGKLPAGLDVTGHELTHGVVFSTADLVYENQSGALNEHLADFFGCMVDRGNWYLGEDACIGTSKLRLRDMSDPHSSDAIADQPKSMSEFRNLPNTAQGDHGGVHENSGIVNYAAYLFTAGPQGLGREKAERIIYRALTTYLSKYSQFIDYRHAVLSAAQDLYPDGSAASAIIQAFNAVEILEGQATPSPTPVPAASGEEQAVFIREETDFFGFPTGYGLYLLAGQNVQPIASRFLARARPAVSGDGQWGLYIGADNNVYWTDGSREEAWTQTGDVRSIAMTKDQHYIAFTTTDYDNSITVIDTVSDGLVTATLRVPTTGAGNNLELSFADVLSFNCIGDILVFDAFTELSIGQSAYGTWGLYGLRIKDLVCFSLLPPVPDLEIGDPSMAHTLPYNLVANYIYTTNGTTTLGMVSLDLANNSLGVLANGLNVLPNPSFRGDDKKVVFSSLNNDGLYYFNEASLAADRSSLEPNSIITLIWSQNIIAYPVGFRAGEYTPPTPRLSISPSSVDFGSVSLGQSAIGSLVLTNSGNADLELISSTFEGADANSFEFTSPIQNRMAVGQAQVLQLKFQPGKVGPLSSNLRFKTTAPSQPDAIIPLSGGGFPSTTAPSLTFIRAANGIQLSWPGGGILESSPRVTGPWVAVNPPDNPQTVAITGAANFYRVRE